MWPFKRPNKIDDDNVPPEVQQYYESEHRERVGLAWLIAFMSLVVTIAVVVGLFFGGRWTFRKIRGNSTPISTTQTITQHQPSTPGPQVAAPASNQPTVNVQNQPDTTPSVSSTTSVSQPKAKTNSKSSSKQLVNTGPGDTLAIFVLATSVGTFAHAAFRRFQLARAS